MMVWEILEILLPEKGNAHQVGILTWGGYITRGFMLLATLLVMLFVDLQVFPLIAIPDHDPYVYHHTSDTYWSPSDNFFQYLYVGDVPLRSEELPAPPTGDGVLRGRITHNDLPARGVTLSVILNSEYKARNLVTDTDGIFTINLPPGTWAINAVETRNWEEKPATGSFSLYHGDEEKIVGNHYHRFPFSRSSAHKATVTTEPDEIHFAITINEDISMVWPPTDERRVVATIDDAIRWERYPGAEKYFVEIQHVERRGSSTTYTPITSHIVENDNVLPLSSIDHAPAKTADATEYDVQVLAFDGEGTLLAQNPDVYMDGSFLLSDGNVLVGHNHHYLIDMEWPGAPNTAEEAIEALLTTDRRADAALVLIEEGLLTEAEALLNLMDSAFAMGRKELLLGYVFALRDECTEADAMFEKARALDPEIRVPDAYRGRCD